MLAAQDEEHLCWSAYVESLDKSVMASTALILSLSKDARRLNCTPVVELSL
ncbi:hypothetical protein [Aminobacter sp. AP02]|uniref:hypothetical protein n=1 Tax=Aminobacter sp. AP02 TaxID=2135737 RepID=UPI000D7A1CC0|nr:hypothetical protein [Aminobacter sp. AP02]PWK72797.1 hypothetical protein C8K44_105240 [Aminobacter sp. AP02]